MSVIGLLGRLDGENIFVYIKKLQLYDLIRQLNLKIIDIFLYERQLILNSFIKKYNIWQ